MTRKQFNLISAIIGGLETIAVGVVTFCEPANATAINSAIIIIGTAGIEACAQFVKE